jgi:hypothetical protein
LQLDDGEEVIVLEEILPALKQNLGHQRKNATVVVKEASGKDAPSKNLKNYEVQTLIVICSKMEVDFFFKCKKTR